jgi:hypothetical protein
VLLVMLFVAVAVAIAVAVSISIFLSVGQQAIHAAKALAEFDR